MIRLRISLSALLWTVAFTAVAFAIVRWGLRLPNDLANGSIQPIVIGSAPMVSLLALGLILTLKDWVQHGSFRPFWLGFLPCGLIAVAVHAAHAILISQPFHHYSVGYEMMINTILRRCGMTWDPQHPGGHAVRYAIVITGLVLLLALPQFIFAFLGGWLLGRSRWAHRVAMGSQEHGAGKGDGDNFKPARPANPPFPGGAKPSAHPRTVS
jgi:hypothetical protein